MKKNMALALFCLFMTSCSVTRFHSGSFNYTEGIQIEPISTQDTKTLDGGNSVVNTTFVAGPGTRFRSFVFEVANTSNEEQSVDFSEFYLVDSRGNKYQADSAGQTMKVTLSEKMVHKIKAGKKRTFVVDFMPAFPMNEKYPILLAGDKVIQLQ